MSEEPKQQNESLNVYMSYALVALFAGIASVVIVCVALTTLRTISDGEMWAIAVMAAAPAAMGVGIAYFMGRRPSQ